MIDPESFRQYFVYLSPSGMYKNLSETIDSEENKAQVNKIDNRLTNLIEKLKSNPTSYTKKIKNRSNTLETVERNLYFNQLNQQGQGLKNLTASQMLSRLTITLAQLKARNNSEKL